MRYPMDTRRSLSLTLSLLVITSLGFARNNLATTGNATTNSGGNSDPQRAIDGREDTSWIGESTAEGSVWLMVELPGHTEVKTVSFSVDLEAGDAPIAFAFQKWMNGRWWEIVRRDFDGQSEFEVDLDKEVLVDQMRLEFFGADRVAVREVGVFGEEYAADLSELRGVILNQSGFNIGRPKRFTAPGVADGTPFRVENVLNREVGYRGVVTGEKGDFSAFNPQISDEFVVVVGESESFPFRIGPYWFERVSYQGSIDFMAGARHYLGTTRNFCTFSWEWRDGDFFNWALQTLIAQYLSNPAAYDRLNPKIKYVPNDQFPEEYRGLWGALDAPAAGTPDLVRLIHWDADVKLSQQLEHEHQKAELAHFLYAYPHLKQWLPQQNFDAVYAYAKHVWTKSDVREDSTTKYDRSEGHDLLALKTKLGTNKGELPPGSSVIPNLMMYEVALSQGEADAEKYFDAAHRQMAWMIANLDWEDPMTTKGQRMSEHITMRAFAYFHNEFPDRAPTGLQQKVHDWVEVAVRRSANLWDFRRFTDDAEWAPLGWNETGNILGFPAAAYAAKSVISDDALKSRLDELAWSHFDSGFGRNPLGRHASYDGPREIEGVDLGWFNAHKGGIGLLEPVPFVFDGSPKAEHFPNHPELGNIGWTEGWVQFNIAFNTSLAYLANDTTKLELEQTDEGDVTVRLRAPLNFHAEVTDQVDVELRGENGQSMTVRLTESGMFSRWLSATLPYRNGTLRQGDQSMAIKPGERISTSYGLGYFAREASWVVRR
ncbi:MAG: hypothetical protein SynsKO_03780 [Synoicihabitans sp.]